MSNNVNISKDVIATIASLATNEVEGVLGITQSLGNAVSKLIKKKNNSGTTNIFVEIDEEKNEVSVSMAVTVEFGYELKPTAEKIQDRVKNQIEAMTNLKVISVDVEIEDIKKTVKE